MLLSRNFLGALTVSAGVLIGSACNAGVPRKAQAQPVAQDAVVIDGVIAQGNIDKVGDELLRRAAAGVENVDMVINSPGGSVTTGFMFIDKMVAAQKMGLKVRCLVVDVAASMAFGILVHCDERVSLSKSFLLWHPARIMGGRGPLTAQDLLKAGRDLESVDKLILDEVLDAMDMPEDQVKYHFYAETLHVGTNLHALAPKFITAYDYVEGLYEALSNKKLVRSEEPSIFFFWNPKDLIYISPYFVN